MQPFLAHVLRRPFRNRRTSALGRVAAVTGIVGLLLLSSPGTAFAQSPSSGTGPSALAQPDSDPSSGQEASPPAADPTGPTFSFDGRQDFSPRNAITIHGTKDAGSTISVLSLTTGNAPVCSIDDHGDNLAVTWACSFGLPNGKGIVITADQTLNGTVTEAKHPIDVLGAPTIDGGPGYLTSGLLSGRGFAGTNVTTVVDGSLSGGCTSTVAASGYWSCAVTAGSGQHVVQAQQSWSDSETSDPTGGLSIVVDKDAPASPVIRSPRAGSHITGTRIVSGGTGETGAVVDVYVGNTPVCTAQVSGGSWSCGAGGITPGTHAVRAIQRDGAGNYSAPSRAITVYFDAVGSSPGPSPAVPPAVPPPGTPTPSQTPGPTPTPGPSRTPAPAAPGPSSTWGTPTGFGASLPTLAETIVRGNWLMAPVLAVGFILLVALPLRLLLMTLRGRIRRPSMRLLGRNRGPDDELTAAVQPKPVNPWLAGAIPLAIAVLFIVMSAGLNNEVRYLRLVVAVGIGLSVLNVVGVAAATRLGALSQGISGRLRFLPMLLVAAALAAPLSRWTGLQPPVVVGVLIGIGFTGRVPVRRRALVNLTEIGAVMLLAVAAWLFHGWLGPVDGFWASALSEMLATVALAGLGSAIVLVLPVATLPGRVLLEWSLPIWLVTTAIVSVIVSAVILGGAGANFPVIGSLAVATAFAALSLAVWAWMRFVEPVPERG